MALKKKKSSIKIQIIPTGTGQYRTLTLKRWMILVAKIFLAIFLLVLVLIAFKLTKINSTLSKAKFYKQTNEKLIERHKEYEKAFNELDSIYSMELKINNIMQTYMENDSNKINSILDKNRFHHTPSEKTKIHFDYLFHNYKRDTLRAMNAPDITPVIGTITKVYNEKENHFGVDFAAPMNQPIFATEKGKVVFSGDQEYFGITIEIKNNDIFSTKFAHLARSAVKKGEYVRKGQIIGYVGLTGNTSGPHLHYEILKNNKNVNPEKYFNHY